MFQGTGYDFDAAVKMVSDAGLMASCLCSIYAPTPVSGAPTGARTPVAGLQAIACMNAPLSVGAIQATEVKALAEIESMSLRHVLLNTYYPALDGLNWGDIGWQADLVDIVKGVPQAPITYDIFGAERDSQNSQTRLKLRLVSV